MYSLLSKLVEIFSDYLAKFIERKSIASDTDVAVELNSILIALQEICIQGEGLLSLVEELLNGTGNAAKIKKLEVLLTTQLLSVKELRETLTATRALLATIDAQFYIDLAPFLDQKSGLLTRWLQQASQSKYSTTTLFFLPMDRLEELLAISRKGGFGVERTDYLVAASDIFREIRSHEFRDIRSITEGNGGAIKHEILNAHVALARAKSLCSELLSAIQQNVGPTALTHLRRQLVKKPSTDPA